MSALQVPIGEAHALERYRLCASADADAAGNSVHRVRASETVIGFDFGTRRIGVAVGDTALGIAHPLQTITAEDNRRRFEAIAALVQEWRPARLILGVPAGGRDPGHALMPALERFERRLRARFGLPLERVDETLSSWEASRRMSERGVAANSQRSRLDAMAACLILQDWFDRGARARPDAEATL